MLLHNNSVIIIIIIVLLFFRSKKVIYSLSWSKEDMASAATREVPMTKPVVGALTTPGGIQDDAHFCF